MLSIAACQSFAIFCQGFLLDTAVPILVSVEVAIEVRQGCMTSELDIANSACQLARQLACKELARGA